MNGELGYPKDAHPHIQWRHIDGPVLVTRKGTLKWLSLWDILMVKFGKHDVYFLEKKYWNHRGC